MAKLAGDTKMSDEEILRVVNEALNSDYERLGAVPLEKLKRALLLLQIAQLCIEHDISIFQCGAEDINCDDPNPGWE